MENFVDQDTKEQILKANLEVHRVEAPLYDAIHHEIFNSIEQKRLYGALRDAAARIPSSNRRALDIGCGTGNVTLKLLELGFTVDALDLSIEMVEELRTKASDAVKTERLHLHCGILEALDVRNDYGLITFYSVLHHLPDYMQTVALALDKLGPGGILFIDHEHVSSAKQNRAYQFAQKILSLVDQTIRFPYLAFRKVLKLFFPTAYGRLRPNIDYSVSDYWVHCDRTLDIDAMESLAVSKGCSFQKTMYLNFTGTWSAAVLHVLFRSSAVDTYRLVMQKSIA